MTNSETLKTIVHITGVAAKHWNDFDVTSPGGVPFAGYVCMQESDYLGTLAITRIAGHERLEIIPAMPKIHYPYVRDERAGLTRVVVPLPINVVDARFTRKLDGTAVIFYALPDEEGAPLEVIPRTRLQPVLRASRWGDWPALLDQVMPDRTPIERAVREQKFTLCFELWGYRNPHLVQYDVPLAFTLHTAVRYRPGRLASYRILQDLAQRYGFDLVPSIRVERPDAEALAAAYRALQEQLEARNRAAGPDTFVEEGAVLVISTRDTAVYYKCKPPSIEEIHFAAGGGISKEIIRQALLKMAERDYDFATGRVEDLEAELSKDFDSRYVESQQELIRRVWLEFIVELQQRDWLRELVEQSGLDPRTQTTELMRHLSRHYPRQRMKWVYSTVKILYG